MTLAVEATNSLLLESILRELTLLNDIKCSLTDPDSSSEPLRAIIEFLDGDVDRPPRVFPMAGSMEGDGELCRGIKRRWKTAE